MNDFVRVSPELIRRCLDARKAWKEAEEVKNLRQFELDMATERVLLAESDLRAEQNFPDPDVECLIRAKEAFFDAQRDYDDAEQLLYSAVFAYDEAHDAYISLLRQYDSERHDLPF